MNSNRFREYHCRLPNVFLQYDDDLSPAGWYLNSNMNLQLHTVSQHASAPEVLPDIPVTQRKLKSAKDQKISLPIKTNVLYIHRSMSLLCVIVFHLCNTAVQQQTDYTVVQLKYLNSNTISKHWWKQSSRPLIFGEDVGQILVSKAFVQYVLMNSALVYFSCSWPNFSKCTLYSPLFPE